MPNSLATDGAGSVPEIETTVRKLQAELSEARRVEEELRRQNHALELRLSEEMSELAEVHEDLQREMQQRVRDQQEIRLLNENLVRQKNAIAVVSQELDHFTYAISHDFRAPLRHLLGFSEALVEQLGQTLDAGARGYLDCVVKAGHKLDAQVQALVNLSRITRQKMQPASVDLGQLVREAVASLTVSAPERKVIFTIADKLTVQGDAALLKVALENLVNNAWKYTRKRDPATIELGRRLEGEGTVYFLSDNGAGFDMRYADKLFSPFQRMHAESEFEGIGVGLAMVQRIIHRHGGRIWADARVDGGATIFFTLAD